MNDIKIFHNPQFGEIRTAGTSEEPLFCLADLCRVLEIGNVSDTRKRLDPRGCDSIEVLTKGGKQQMIFVNEKNLYKVIMRSDKPQAEPFQDWVCGEVLPSIRKHGAYMTEEVLERTLTDPDFMMGLLTKIKEERLLRVKAEHEAKMLQAENDLKDQQLKDNAPKVVFTDAVVGSRSSCLIGELAKLITQAGFPIGQNRLFKWMRESHYLGTVGEYRNIPCQKFVEMGLFELKKGIRTGYDGQLITTMTPKVTGKGQVYFVNLFTNKSVGAAV